ncbi:MAG: hypothetical protein ACLGIF_03060 [Actinomycetes bacterium]
MCGGCAKGTDRDHDEPALVFDTAGLLTEDEAVRPPDLLRPRACDLETLNGSWLVTVEDRLPTVLSPLVRGPMRIEVGSASLRVSGDIYVQRRTNPGFPGPGLVIDPTTNPSYPAFPMSQYAWYFRSTGVTYRNGELRFGLVRHLWDKTTSEFVSTDTGEMVLSCRQAPVTPFGRPPVMTGSLSVGGTRSRVTATKTSDLYRGCRIEVDVMTGRTFPASAVTGSGAAADLRSVYATAGWDVTVSVDEIGLPEDAELTNAELDTLMRAHAGAASGEDWRLWLFVGSAQGSLFGIMFDDDTVPRQGAAGFADASLSDENVIEPGARNRPLDEVPAAFLRTLVHEAGHAFNLFHPKHDTHAPPLGTEIMNQTGDVIGFATPARPYPGNASFFFASHDRDSLIHAPDPQVRPGWKNFGWGHGSLSAGLPTPVDATGLVGADEAAGLALSLSLPSQVFVGEYVTAAVRVTNTGDTARAVSARLNLAEGDLRLLRVEPTGAVEQVRDIVVACGPRPMVTLEPGTSVEAHLQVYFTSAGFTFAAPGRHQVGAEFEADAFSSVRSEPVMVDVRSASTDTELDIARATLDTGVGRALALGDFGADAEARQRLSTVAEQHADSDTGAAAALVMANALFRRHVDHAGDAVREVSSEEAEHYLDLAVQGRSAERLLELAVTVASPVEKETPVVAAALARVQADGAAESSLDRAADIAATFRSPTAR